MNRVFPLSVLRSLWAAVPVTGSLILAAIGFSVAVALLETDERDRSAAFRAAGLLQIQRSPADAELYGPFDLWAGQWGRIPLGALHHVNGWHLAIAVLALAACGGLLEPRLHWAVFLPFVIGALLITSLARWGIGANGPAWLTGNHAALGLSGVAFACFGFLIALRRHDRTLARRFGDGGILLGVVLGLGCLACSVVGLMSVDNLAHGAGFFYGLGMGGLISSPALWPRLLAGGLAVAHLGLVGVFDHLVHPLHNARYQWWLAEQSENSDERRERYQQALALDPMLRYPWLALAEDSLSRGEPLAAWRSVLEGLRHHPRLPGSAEWGRRIWAAFPTRTERQQAWRSLANRFPHDHDALGKQLLSARQLVLYLMETDQTLDAWNALMHQLRGLPLPQASTRDQPDFLAAKHLAELIWSRFPTDADRRRALVAMDRLVEERRRAWHQLLIPRRELIGHYSEVGELFWAWLAVLEELRDDPAFFTEGSRQARTIWERFPTELRRERARTLLEDCFGVEELEWKVQLGIFSEAEQHRYRLDQSIQLPDSVDPPSSTRRPLNPDHPQSAAEGVLL